MWLETNRLIIRSIQRGDEIIFSGMSQDGSLSQVGFDANCSEWINDWIEEALKSVGSTYYEDVDKVGICYFIGTPFRKKGYMTEAINAYVQFFFKQYSESEIIATILDANTPSWKVAEKSGFNLIEKKMYKDIDDEKEELYRFYVIRGQEDK